MSPALLIRLRPAGPWRYGPGDGAHDRVDSLFRSDRLYSAVCHAMLQLGFLEEWLDATARSAQPAVVLSSLFPFQGDTLFVPAPETIWPPAPAALRTPSPVFLTKVRWRAAKFVPMAVVETLLMGMPLQADQWIADAESGCLLRRDRPQSSPFRLATRARVPVDRLTGVSGEPHKAACVEFEQGAGLWTVVLFASAGAASNWTERLTAAFRFLCDTGFGGSRSAGWGQAGSPEISEGNWPGILLPKLERAKTAEPPSSLHWLLSVYSPADSDVVEWGEGRYTLVLRGGRVESKAGCGAEKKTVRMVTEGSVLSAAAPIYGRAVDVAPDGFAHPVYRAGFALALRLPVIHIVDAPDPEPVVGEMDAALAAALAAAEEERSTAEAKAPPAGVEPAEAPIVEKFAGVAAAGPDQEHVHDAQGSQASQIETANIDQTEIASAEMEGSHPLDPLIEEALKVEALEPVAIAAAPEEDAEELPLEKFETVQPHDSVEAAVESEPVASPESETVHLSEAVEAGEAASQPEEAPAIETPGTNAPGDTASEGPPAARSKDSHEI
jgi:CRISPR type III-A-associated RAMP protein Csm4